MTSNLVDLHCHLDLYPDHAAVVAECDRLKIFTLAVTTTPRAWPRNHELASATKHVRAALGLHPQLVKEYANELSIWRDLLPRARYVGEVGLDAGRAYYASFDAQKLFERILRDCAAAGGKILTIHSVRAGKAVLDMIETFLPPARGSAVLHWFTGTKADAARAVKLGMYFSINREMLRNERHRELVSSLPLDRLLTGNRWTVRPNRWTRRAAKRCGGDRRRTRASPFDVRIGACRRRCGKSQAPSRDVIS